MGIYNTKASMKGQVTIPAEVRDLLGLEPGGAVQFRTSADGAVSVFAKKKGALGLKGIFPKPPKPIDDDMAIAKEVWRRNKPGADGDRS
jgi:antitoxin PrlF